MTTSRWQPSTLRVDKILAPGSAAMYTPAATGKKVYGYIYDAGSDGGAGMNRFGEIVLTIPVTGGYSC